MAECDPLLSNHPAMAAALQRLFDVLIHPVLLMGWCLLLITGVLPYYKLDVDFNGLGDLAIGLANACMITMLVIVAAVFMCVAVIFRRGDRGAE
jgi:hypothetical protein